MITDVVTEVYSFYIVAKQLHNHYTLLYLTFTVTLKQTQVLSG